MRGRVIFAVLIAPFVEELFFRGFIFGMYRRRKSRWVAYVASSVLFAGPHLLSGQSNPAQLAGLGIGIMVLALVLAWLYDTTGSLYPGILAHAVEQAEQGGRIKGPMPTSVPYQYTGAPTRHLAREAQK